MTVAAVQSADAGAAAGVSARLLVTRRDPDTRGYRAIGFLAYDGQHYNFAYLRTAVSMPGFHSLPGLSDTTRAHDSDRLFPIFAERVISARRPDRQTSMDALGLGMDAAPFEVLQRSGGRRVGDTIEVLPAPTAAPDGSLTVDFLVHGVRYRPPEVQERISQLHPGDELRIVPELDNQTDFRALLVTDRDALPLGYVPSPLLELVHALSDPTARVLRANGPLVGFHFRLLARIAGRVPAGHQPFGGPAWETVG